MQTFIDLLRSDGSIIINKKLANTIGTDATILYSELLSRYEYFRKKKLLDKSGYFYNTIADIREATILTGYQQRKAIKILEKFNLIATKICGLPATRYFKIIIDEGNIRELLQSSC